MGRPSKAVAALARARQPVPAPASTDPLDDVSIRELSARFLEVRGQTTRAAVGAAAELGEILHGGRQKLVKRGLYRRWTDQLGVRVHTAANYVALAAWSRTAPGTVTQWQGLGLSKLYRLARLEPEGRRTVLQTAGVAAMDDSKFAQLVAPHIKRKREVTGTMRGHGLRERVRAFKKRLRAPLPAIDSDEVREGLRQELSDVATLAKKLAGRLQKRRPARSR